MEWKLLGVACAEEYAGSIVWTKSYNTKIEQWNGEVKKQEEVKVILHEVSPGV
jgi:hypothetical protein